MNKFNEEAFTWDKKRRRTELAKSVVNEIKHELKNKNILEFGCATGLVGLNIADVTKSLTGIDTAENMVNIFNQKAKKLSLNAKAYKKDIFEINSSFDAVISSMTLHHIKDIRKLNEKLIQITKRVYLADLVKEDGTFHTRGNEGVYHFGFTLEELRDYFKGWEIDYKIIHTIKKHKNFDVFLLKLRRDG